MCSNIRTHVFVIKRYFLIKEVEMGVYLALQNNDEIFNRSIVTPIIINDLNTATQADRDYIDKLISTSYETDMLSNEPSCACGQITGGFELNVICPNCKTSVKEIFDQELQTHVWMRAPNGVRKFINPMILTQLSVRFTKSKFNLIEWLCNTDYQPNVNRPDELGLLIDLGVKRGYNNFIDHFDEYIDILFSLNRPKLKKDIEEDLQKHIRINRDKCMSWHLPLPNKSLLVIEKTEVGIFVDPIVVGAIDAIRTMCGIDTKLINFTQKQKENRAAKTLFILCEFCNDIYHDILSSKNGLFRKHIFGSRNYFSARTVISSNTKIHKYDELHISWGVGVTMLKIHLTNKLLKLGWVPNNIFGLLQESSYKYNELLDNLFNELIRENPEGGIPTAWGRNPSLSRGSLQKMRITKVKTDVDDPTITMSILAVKAYNA